MIKRTLVYIWLLTISRICISSDIQYSISVLDMNKNCASFEAKMPTDEMGRLVIKIPYGLTTFNLAPEFKSVEDINSYTKKITFHKKTEARIGYDLCSDESNYQLDYPIINEKYFQFTALTALIMPDYRQEQELNILFKLANVPADFRLFTSSGEVHSTEFSYTGPVSNFTSYTIVAAKDHVQSMDIGDKKIYGLSNDEQAAFPNGIVKKMKKVLSYQYNLMGETDANPLLIAVISAPEIMEFGRFFENTLLLSFKESVSEDKRLRAFAHEHFHKWLGKLIVPRDGEGDDLVWFLEGIDDYIGIKSAYQAGAISYSEYVSVINKLLIENSLSPLSHVSYKDLLGLYLRELQYTKDAQIRGQLVSLMIQGEKTLPLAEDPVLRITKKILESRAGSIVSISFEELEKHFIEHVGNADWQNLKYFINTGENLNLPLTLDRGRATLRDKKVRIADYGFDLDALIRNRVISGLEDDAPAYRAGLRNGMQVLSHNLSLSDPDKKIRILVLKDDKAVPIFFVPDTKYAVIQQYVESPKIVAKIVRFFRFW